VLEKKLGKELFAECCISQFLTLGKELFVECQKTLDKELIRRVFSFTECFYVALGKVLIRRVFSFTECFLRGTRQRALCRVPEKKHSAKNLALGKEPNSGSDCRVVSISY
jgi:hypothetical protein